MEEERYMKAAIALAEKGAGFVNPNPLVGAVIVKNGRITGRGFHEKFGGPHAERNALQSCTEPPEGATMYVTLEPCCHYGKTPPCTEAILKSGIAKVVIGSPDPNPKVAGKGIAQLKQAGVKVVSGVLEEECKKQNEVFFHFIHTKTPFVVMKYAMTIDGKIATATGASQWITGSAAREKVHKDRHRYSGIMVGINTVLADDPLLTCRAEGGQSPVRIVCDTNLRIPVEARLVATAQKIRTIIATGGQNPQKQRLLQKAGCEILQLPLQNGRINLQKAMQVLGKMGIDSILLEGGGAVNFSALESGVVQKVHTYIAPKLFGGETAKTPVGGAGFKEIEGCVRLKNSVVSRIGEDIFIESEVAGACLQEL